MNSSYRIRLNKPARYWDDGLPLGNGKLGMMVMGKPDEETIIINEETVWYGADRDRKNPDTYSHLQEIRNLLRAGEVQKAQFLAKMAMTSAPKYMNPYQPAGDMRLCFLDHKYPVAEYDRSLNLNDALCTVSYRMNGQTYFREHFVSHRYNVAAIKLKADSLTFSVNMSRKPFEEHTQKLDEKTVCSYEQLGAEGLCCFTGIRLACKGGKVDTIGDFVYVTDAQEAYIYLTAGTDFADPDYRSHCLERLDTAEAAGYETIKKAHIEEYHAIYDRMQIHFDNTGEFSDKYTDELLAMAGKEGDDNEKAAVYLAEMLFSYARYLLISSSGDCLLPANLQGIWNGEYVPPWQSEFTININTEMNYWMAEKSNLSECHMPLFSLVDRMVPKGMQTAEKLYGCDGFCAHHNTNIWGNTDPEGIFDASPIWPMGGAWLALHFFEHYEYTADIEFLKRRAMPVMKLAIQFFEKYLTETEEGYLITGPTVSPENTYQSGLGIKGALCMGASMDSQILEQLCSSYMKGCAAIRGTDDCEELTSYESTADSIRNRLVPIRLTEDGRIREWMEEYEEPEPGHRHISHLFALHPGTQITVEKQELFRAARKTLEKRLEHGGGHTGWSCAWIACFWARLKDGGQVWNTIRKMLGTCIKVNLLDTHPPFQIDGNFGIADCMIEMLVQDHAGYIEFLPAIPEQLSSGYVKGMVLRNAVTADFSWKGARITELTLKAKQQQRVELHINGEIRRLILEAGQNTISV